MNITLNGERREFPEGLTVVSLLGLLNIQHQRVAVELNESIVKKDRYSDTIIKDGDLLEVVSFMAGGSGAFGSIVNCKLQSENCKLKSNREP